MCFKQELLPQAIRYINIAMLVLNIQGRGQNYFIFDRFFVEYIFVIPKFHDWK